ncbi:MAG: DEAD/DEAH box helicase, partial [Armatimonadetes bacterium]|nr:DEAD/DEAH box helicase [Armatimonadota bacterium]
MDFTAFLADIRKSRHYRGQIVYVQHITEREAEYDTLSIPLPPELVSALDKMGISNLYTHQVEAIESVRAGKSIAVVTGTASGKTLCYNLPILEALLKCQESRGRMGERESGRMGESPVPHPSSTISHQP